jgi:deazaflavin-dependent oxidoreductase (nitroreductase family)
MQLPRSLARFNRKVVNPIQSRWAGQLRPWIILVHTGRRSGRTYRTPMLAWKRGDLLMIGILYGTQSSWVRNVLAAEGGEVIRAGAHYRLRNPRLEDPAGRSELSTIGRLYTRVSHQALVAVLVPTS